MHESKKAEGAAAVADIEEFADGLVCLTGGDEGMLASALVQGGGLRIDNSLKGW